MPIEKAKEPLRIGILSFYYPHLGGSGIVATRLAKNLAEKGHEIHFIGYDTDENQREMEELGVQLHKVRKIDYPCLKNEPYILTLGSRICKVHKEVGLDVIHANYAIPHAVAAYLARDALEDDVGYLPYVVTGHGSDIHTNGHKEDVLPILRRCLNKADALTFVSRHLQSIAEESLGIKKSSEVIPNFVDTEHFRKKKTNLRERLDIPENAFVIGHVSNFAPIKKVYRFGYLAERLKADGVMDQVYFLMCGDGTKRHALEDRMKKIEVSDHCRFLGIQDSKQLVESYNAMDVFLLTSKYEGNPLTLLEAMACEVPVIGTMAGGIKETIGDEGGFLFRRGERDVSDLSRIVHRLKNNPVLSAEVGKKGREKVQREYATEEVVDRYLKIYNSVRAKK